MFSGVEYNYSAAIIAVLVLFFFYTSGIVALSTCFNDALDADEVLETPGSIFEFVRYLLSFALFVISCAPASFPPYLGTRTPPRTCHNLTRTLPRTCHNLTRTLPRLIEVHSLRVHTLTRIYPHRNSYFPISRFYGISPTLEWVFLVWSFHIQIIFLHDWMDFRFWLRVSLGGYWEFQWEKSVSKSSCAI